MRSMASFDLETRKIGLRVVGFDFVGERRVSNCFSFSSSFFFRVETSFSKHSTREIKSKINNSFSLSEVFCISTKRKECE